MDYNSRSSKPGPSRNCFTPNDRSFHEESGEKLLLKFSSRPPIKELEPVLLADTPHPSTVVQLTGAPGSGKTIMLVHLVACALLPKTWKGVRLGGTGTGVLFLACNSDFNIFLLENILKRKVNNLIKSCVSALKSKNDTNNQNTLIDCSEEVKRFLHAGKECMKEELNNLVTQCLKRFLLLKVYESTQFAVTLKTIDRYFIKYSHISFMVIDNINAFYWWDHVFRTKGLSQAKQYYNGIMEIFLNHVKDGKIVVISSCQWPMGKPRQLDKNIALGKEGSFFNFEESDVLGSTWQQSVAVQIHLSIIRSRSSKSDISTETEGSSLPSSKHKEILKVYSNDNRDKLSLKKEFTDSRTKYSAEVISEKRSTLLHFTVHEEGVRWCN